MFFIVSKLFSFLISPWFYALLIYFFALYYSKKIKKVFYTLILLGIYFFILSSPLTAKIIKSWENQQYELPANIDSIIVLGGGSLYYNKIKEQFIIGGSFSRFLEASRLLKKSQARFLIISGGDPGGLPDDIEKESLSVDKFYAEIGINKDNILIENESKNTYQEALLVKDLLQKHQIKELVVITDAVHLKRSLQVFQKQGIKAYGYPVNFYIHPLADRYNWSLYNIEKFHLLIHEWVGLVAYKMMGYI